MEDHLIFWNSSLRSTTEETNFYTEVLTEFELLLDGIPWKYLYFFRTLHYHGLFFFSATCCVQLMKARTPAKETQVVHLLLKRMANMPSLEWFHGDMVVHFLVIPVSMPEWLRRWTGFLPTQLGLNLAPVLLQLLEDELPCYQIISIKHIRHWSLKFQLNKTVLENSYKIW